MENYTKYALKANEELIQLLEGKDITEIIPSGWSEQHGDGWERIYTKENVGVYAIPAFPAITYYTEDQQTEIDEIRMVMESHIESNVAKFITGARNLSEFDQFVKELEDMGLRDLEEIYQEAYAAYLEASK